MSSKSQPHVVIFPYMAQGHTLPLLDLSKSLSKRGIKITIITTPSNAPFIHSITSSFSSISLSAIPFPKVKDLPDGCENTSDLPSLELLIPFIKATSLLRQPFEAKLKELCDCEDTKKPLCVISDFFLGWTVESCNLFGIPRISSMGMGVLPMVILKNLTLNPQSLFGLSQNDVVSLPNGLSLPFTLYKRDLPQVLIDYHPENPLYKIVSELEEQDVNSYGVVVNSFEVFESDYVSSLTKIYKEEAKVCCVGPLFLLDQTEDESYCPYIEWLDRRFDPVIYVSFGSEAELSTMQMDEIANGLEMAGQPFIWVTRSKTWDPPIQWTDKIKKFGLVIKDWVDQRRILSHPSIGGFMTHCGWNSIIEGLSMGVPLLTWPMGAEQRLNAKYVSAVLKTGFMVSQAVVDEKMGTVDRRVVCDRVKALMREDEGRFAREKAKEIERKAKEAVAKGGSSDTKLDQLIESLFLN